MKPCAERNLAAKWDTRTCSSPECRDYLKSRKPSQREREIAKLEKQADNKHDIYGNKSLYEVSGEIAAIYESQQALRLRLESIEEKLDRLLEFQK